MEIVSILTATSNNDIISQTSKTIIELEPHPIYQWIPTGYTFDITNIYDSSIGHNPRTGSGALDVDKAMNYSGPIGLIDINYLDASESHELELLDLDIGDVLIVSFAWERPAFRTNLTYRHDDIENLDIAIMYDGINLISQTSSVFSNNEVIRYQVPGSGTYAIDVLRVSDDSIIYDFSYSYIIE